MTRIGTRHRSPARFFVAALVLAALPAAAPARAADCAALRAAIDAEAPADPYRVDAEMQRRRADIARAKEAADRTGCGDGFFDDPDSPACRALARRSEAMQVELRRLQDRVARGEADDGGRRRDLQARFDAECAASLEGDPPGVATVPADPDVPPGPAATPRRATRVFCVRQCDGAYYPLAADVASDHMPDMDRICQAQCPAAASSAYADDGSEDVAAMVNADGAPYSSLATAFAFQKGPSRSCACRAPHQSWAEALAGAEALLPPQKGDVTVTAEISAAMARPVPPAPRTSPAIAKPATKKGKAKSAPLAAPAPIDPGLDLTPAFRRGDPTL